MKRRISTVLAILLVLVITACGAQTPGTENVPPVQEEQQQETTPEDKVVPEAETDDAKEESPDQTEEELRKETETKREIEIYSGNEDATELVTSLAEIPDLAAKYILAELAYKGVVPENVTANDCKKLEKDGRNVLELDLSQSFADFLNGQGTSGETITLGSVCNTFLKAYKCDAVRITVDGQVLETGHAEYPGYMEFVTSVR